MAAPASLGELKARIDLRVRRAFAWALWGVLAVGLWAGLAARYLDARSIPPHFTPERIQPIVADGIHAALDHRPAPSLPALYDDACYGWLRDVCWWALHDAGLDPLKHAQGGESWLRKLDEVLRSEGSWPPRRVLRPDCVGLECRGIPNDDGTLDRGCCGYNDRWRVDAPWAVPDRVAFNVVLAIRQVAHDWGAWVANGRSENWGEKDGPLAFRWPGEWCGLNWPGGC